jgi:DNA polymerase-3 subunit alpha
VAECQKQEIPVLKPDMNRSGVQFDVESLDDGCPAVRFGLAIVKNVGESAVSSIVEARADQADARFTSLFDVCKAVDSRSVNKRLLESLIKCGAMDEFGSRADLIASLDSVYSAAQQQQKAAQRGQMDLFGGQEVAPLASATNLVSGDAIPKKTLLSWEKEYLGVYLTENPLTDLHEAARASGRVFQTIGGIDSDIVGEQVQLLAMIRSIRRIVTRTNKTMAILEIEDLTGVIEAVLFPESYERCSAQLLEDTPVAVRAKVDERNDSVQLLIDEMTAFEVEEIVVASPAVHVMVTIHRNGSLQEQIDAMNRLAALCREFRGDDSLYIRLRLGEQQRLLRSGFRVDWCDDLRKAIADLVGGDCVGELGKHSAETPYQMVAD